MCTMSQEYSRSLLRVCVAQICQQLGWTTVQTTPMELLTDVLERYVFQLADITHRYSEQFGRTEPNLDDLGLSFQDMNVNLDELEDYVRHVDPLPFAGNAVNFPVPKTSDLNFPRPQSRELLERKENAEHIDEHLPPVHLDWNEEIISPVRPETNGIPGAGDESMLTSPSDPGLVPGEKRPHPGSGEATPPSKKPRVLPEEAGHSQYKMTGIVISSTGFVTPTRPGKLPDARTPPTARSLPATPTHGVPPGGSTNTSTSLPQSPSNSKPVAMVISETIEERTVVGELNGLSDMKIPHKSQTSDNSEPAVPKLQVMSPPIRPPPPSSSKSPKSSKNKINKDSKSKSKSVKPPKSPKSQGSPKPPKSPRSKTPKSSKKNASSKEPGDKIKQEKKSDVVNQGYSLDSVHESPILVPPCSPPPPTRVAGPPSKKLDSAKTPSKAFCPLDKDEDSQEAKLVIADVEAAKQKAAEAEEVRLNRIDDTIHEVIKYSLEEMDRQDVRRREEEEEKRKREEKLKKIEEIKKKEEEQRKEEQRRQQLERQKAEEEEKRIQAEIKEAEKQRVKAEKAKEKKIQRDQQIDDTIDDVIRQSIKEKDVFAFSDDSEDDFDFKMPTFPTLPDSPERTDTHVDKPLPKSKSPIRSPLKIKIPSPIYDRSASESPDNPDVKEKLKKKLQNKTVSPEWPKVSIPKLTPEEINKYPRFEYPSPEKLTASAMTSPQPGSLSKFVLAGMSSPSPTKDQPPLPSIRIGFGIKDKLTIKSPKPLEKEGKDKEHKKEKKKKKNKDKDKDRDRKDRKDKDRSKDKKDKDRKKDKSKSKSKDEGPADTPSIPRLKIRVGGGGSSNATVSMSTPDFIKSEPKVPEPPKMEIPKLVIKPPSLRPEPPPSRLSPKVPPKPPPPLSPVPPRRHPNPPVTSPPVPLSSSPPPSPIHPSPSPSPPHTYEPPPPPARLPTPPPPSRLSAAPPPSKLSPPPPSMPPSSLPSNASATADGTGAGPCTLITETVGTIIDESGQKIWICPACKLPDDGSPMVGCDDCDDWYHWPCVGIDDEPSEDQWFCPKCNATRQKMKTEKKKKKGPPGKGAKPGKKKKH